MYNRISTFFNFMFSLPVLALINIVFAIFSLIASFSVDESAFSINCDLDNFHNILGGGYSSLQVILSDTAIALRASDFGVPDFIATPLIPLFFAVAWIFKIINNKDDSIKVINGFIALITTIAIIIGCFSKTSLWLDTEQAKSNIWSKKYFVDEVTPETKEIKESLLKSTDKNSCSIALELYTLSLEGYCSNLNMYDCYSNMLEDQNFSYVIEKKTKAWVLKK